MGPMWGAANHGLPKDHWIHKALAKESTRIAKKKTAPTAQKGPTLKREGEGLSTHGNEKKEGLAGLGSSRAEPAKFPYAPPLQGGNNVSV